MKPLTIMNWDTSPRIINYEYINGLVIGDKTDKGTIYGGVYSYTFYKDGSQVLTITMSRSSNAGRYAIRGKNVGGKYSNIYNLTRAQISNSVHVRYVFNEIINSLC